MKIKKTGFSIATTLTLYYKDDTIRTLTSEILERVTMDNNQEKRKYRRYEKAPIEDRFIVKFRIKPGEAQEAKSGSWNSITLMNISAGGIFFLSKKDLKIGSLLDLKINIVHSSFTINCIGKIIRIERPATPSAFGTAIEFLDLDKQEKEMVNAAIEDFIE